MIQFRLMLGDVGDDSGKRVFCLSYILLGRPISYFVVAWYFLFFLCLHPIME